MSKQTEMDVKVKFGLKSFITVVAILLAVLIFVGVLTFVIPAGRYTIYTTDESKINEPFYQYTTDETLNKQIVIDSYRELADGENTTRMPSSQPKHPRFGQNAYSLERRLVHSRENLHTPHSM